MNLDFRQAIRFYYLKDSQSLFLRPRRMKKSQSMVTD